MTLEPFGTEKSFGSSGNDLGTHDAKAVFKAFGYSMGASAIAFVITLIPSVDVPAEYSAVFALMVPTINTALVAVKRFLEDRSSIVERN